MIDLHITAEDFLDVKRQLAGLMDGVFAADEPVTPDEKEKSAEKEKPTRGRKKKEPVPEPAPEPEPAPLDTAVALGVTAPPVESASAPVAPEPPDPSPVEPEPTVALTVDAPSVEALATAGAGLLDADPNSMGKLVELLGRYGVQAITQLKPGQRAGFADDLRAMGAKI